MAQYQDLTFDQGSDIVLELRLLNQDRSKKNLNGYTVSAKMAPSYNSTDSDKISFSTAIESPDSDGIITLSLTNLQTDTLSTKRRYVYDVEISYVSESDGAGNLTYVIERVLEGQVQVTPSVTK